AVRAGGANLAKQIENVAAYGVPSVVAINLFPTDTDAEVEAIREVALAAGAPDFQLLYPDAMPLRDKIEAIATRIYGADGIDVQPAAAKQLAQYESMGFGGLPICM